MSVSCYPFSNWADTQHFLLLTLGIIFPIFFYLHNLIPVIMKTENSVMLRKNSYVVWSISGKANISLFEFLCWQEHSSDCLLHFATFFWKANIKLPMWHLLHDGHFPWSASITVLRIILWLFSQVHRKTTPSFCIYSETINSEVHL